MISTANLIALFIAELVAFFLPYSAFITYDPDYKGVGFLNGNSFFFLFAEFFLSILMFMTFKGSFVPCLLIAIGCGGLLASATLDYQTTSVPDILHYFSILMFIPAICVNYKGGIYSRIEIIGFVFFFLLQFLVFSRTFGFSDALAFVAFGTLCFAQNKGWESMMGGMVVAYLILIAVQLCKRNISKKFKLKKPVAFIPYIFAAYAFTLFIL